MVSANIGTIRGDVGFAHVFASLGRFGRKRSPGRFSVVRHPFASLGSPDLVRGGAGCRIRTRGPLITNQVLYQLS